MNCALISARRLGAAIAFIAAMALGLNTASAAKPPQSYIVIDAASGKTLLSEAPDLAVHPASLTKMMTLYLLFDDLRAGRIKMNSRIKFSRRAARQEPSKLGVRAGRSITVRTAIYALAVKSANDVAVAVAERLSGSVDRFADRMNAKARALGMARTNFVNPSGLHDRKQVSTARDMARLARGLRYKHRNYFRFFKAKSFRYAGRTIRSHNRFVKKYQGADGIKTGYIRASGFNLAGSAVRHGRRLIGVIIGGRTAARRDLDLVGVMDAGFRIVRRAGTPRYAGVAPVAVDWRTGAPARPPRRGEGGAVLMAAAPEAPKKETAVLLRPRQTTSPARRPAATLTPPRRTAGGAYAAQVGAVSSKRAAVALANKRLQDLRGKVPGAAPRVQAHRTARGGSLYRARIAGLTGAQARNACAVLKRAGRDCLVVSPG